MNIENISLILSSIICVWCFCALMQIIWDMCKYGIDYQTYEIITEYDTEQHALDAFNDIRKYFQENKDKIKVKKCVLNKKNVNIKYIASSKLEVNIYETLVNHSY